MRIIHYIVASSKKIIIVHEGFGAYNKVVFPEFTITDHQIDKLSPFLKDTDIILLSVEMKLDLLNWNRLFSMIKKRKNESELPVIYITESKEREQEANDFFRGKKICICKETEPIKIARYLIARYL